MRCVQTIDLTSPIVRGAPPPEIEGDFAIIGLPVYAIGIPAIILPYLRSLRGEGKAAALVAVFGNVSPGLALAQLRDIAETSGFRVAAAASFVAEHSFSTAARPVAAGRPGEADLREAEEFGRLLAAKLDSAVGVALGPMGIPRSPAILLRIKGRMTFNSARLYARAPRLDESLCRGCGICLRACPTGAIDPLSLAVAAGSCIRCCACVKLCPGAARAISFRMRAPVPWLLAAKSKKPKEPRLYL